MQTRCLNRTKAIIILNLCLLKAHYYLLNQIEQWKKKTKIREENFLNK